MTTGKSPNATLHVSPAETRAACGSPSEDLNQVLVNQAVASAWTAHSDQHQRIVQARAVLAAMADLRPADGLEGMLAAQAVATHNAAMECFRRAMLPEQGLEGRRENLAQANRLVRSYGLLLEALDRRRGRGRPQVVRVERVTVEAGGQAVVGNVASGGARGEGGGRESDERSHAKALGHAPEPALRGQDPGRDPVPVAGGEGETPV
jgi:hypothetical protein